MGNNTKNIDVHHNYRGNKIYNSNLNDSPISFIFPDIDVEIGQVYELDAYAITPYTIVSAFLKTDIDSMRVTISINTVPIDGLTDILVGNGITEYSIFTSTTDRVVSVGDSVTLTVTELTDNPSKLIGTIKKLLT